MKMKSSVHPSVRHMSDAEHDRRPSAGACGNIVVGNANIMCMRARRTATWTVRAMALLAAGCAVPPMLHAFGFFCYMPGGGVLRCAQTSAVFIVFGVVGNAVQQTWSRDSPLLRIVPTLNLIQLVTTLAAVGTVSYCALRLIR